MNAFRQWRDWAAELDEAAFARLWRALGCVAASGASTGTPGDRLQRVWREALRAQELHWLWPQFEDDDGAALRAHAPQVWVDAWKTVIGNRLDKAPLRIYGWPRDSPPAEWLAALGSLSPVATLYRESPGKRMPDWPLRLAALAAREQDVLGQATALWPSGRLARIITPQGGCQACDVLLLGGEIDALLPQLQGDAVSAHLVVLCLQRPWTASDMARLDTLIDAVHAGGIIVIESSQGIDLPGRLNRFVEELSHARRTDVAASLAWAGLPALIVMGDALAQFTIRQVAGRLLVRSRSLKRQSALSSAMRNVLDTVISRVPPPAAIPPASGLEARRSGPGESSGGLESLGAEPEMAPPGARGGDALEAMPGGDEAQAAETVPDFERFEAPYDHESGGATSLAEAAEELDRAEASLASDRFLQQYAFVEKGGHKENATHGFVVGQVAVLEVFIGPPERGANAMPDAFPEAELPQDQDRWELQLWLSEPDYLPAPLGGTLVLQRTGKTNTCEFRFTPDREGLFNGRISVLHRGRVLQTATLKAGVRLVNAPAVGSLAPTLGRVLRVRQNLASLERRPFDLAFVLNHAGADQPTAQAMTGQRAWLANLRVVEKTVADLNTLLSGLTRTARDYVGGLDSDKGKTLVRKLALVGSYLHLYLVESQGLAAGDAQGAEVLKGEFIQVVSTRSDAVVIPFEFIYEYDAPDDDATPCLNWRDAVKAGRCPAQCNRDAKTFCPMGFWGMSKVIERHALQPALAGEGEVGVQSVDVDGRESLKISGNAVFGYSNNVKKELLAPLLQRMATAHLNASEARDWKDWATLVGQHKPSLLIALAHADGAGFGATVEIGGQAIKTIGITAAHIRASAESSERPLVALLGCDMAGTGDDYSNPVAVFSMRGAAAVIGTIATVLADDAAAVAARLMQGLTLDDPAQSRRIGEALRQLRRDALLDGELMPLCLVGFGDADRLLSS